mmetsp:Transcript_12747/g.36643  ORF Transcript_12747/g.36643 Transcript_12747/m.36643 type:complete len:604 (+) Transcript_12747:63-1874(+)
MSAVPVVLWWAGVLSTLALLPIFCVKALRALRVASGCCCLCSAAVAPESDPEVSEMVERLVVARRVGIARIFVNAGWSAVCMVGLYVVCQGVAVWGPSPGVHEAPTRIVWLAALLVLTMGAVLPDTFVTARTLPAWLVVASGTICAVSLLLRSGALVGLHADGPTVLLFGPMIIVATLSLGGFCLHFPLLVTSSFCINACWLVAIVDPESTAWEGRVHPYRLVLQQLTLWVWEVLLFYGASKTLHFSAAKEVDAALGKCQGSAVTALLGLVCDAVVDLDSDFTLKDHCSRLAGMLMIQGRKSLRGGAFKDFIAPGDDQQRFQESILESQGAAAEGAECADSVPNMVSVRLRDASGNLFTSALYHLPYRSISGRLNHLIGVQEAPDGPQRQTGSTGPRPLPEAALQPHIAEALDAGAAQVADGCSEGAAHTDQSCASSSSGSRETGRSGSARGAAWSGSLVLYATEGLCLIAGDAAVLERLGLEEHGSFAGLLDAGGARLEASIVETARRVQQTGVAPQGVDLGIWGLTPARSGDAGRFHRCQLPANYHDPVRGVLMVKLFIETAPQTQDSWRKRMGPLRTSRRAQAAEAQQAPSDEAHVSVRL